ncbi:MAG: DMT family transporter [Rhodobacteraceae bacterium]|nr:DMT family transporter [Paracoccaceae bacterium]
MMLATAGFVVNDTLVKLTTTHLPLGQIILIRGLFCIVLIGAICLYRGVFANWRDLANRFVLLRGISEVASTVLYLMALKNLPIANATAILQALPLAVTAGAAIFFGSQVGWRRWTAVLVGFCGVLIIVRPGLEGFDIWSLVVLGAVITMTARDLSTRFVPKHIPTFGISFMTSIWVSLLGGVFAAIEGWEPVTPQSLGLLMLAASFLTVGYVFITASVRSGDLSVVAPFRYSAILWAVTLGFLIWDEIPDLYTAIGTTIVVVTGIYTVWREQKLVKRERYKKI